MKISALARQTFHRMASPLGLGEPGRHSNCATRTGTLVMGLLRVQNGKYSPGHVCGLYFLQLVRVTDEIGSCIFLALDHIRFRVRRSSHAKVWAKSD